MTRRVIGLAIVLALIVPASAGCIDSVRDRFPSAFGSPPHRDGYAFTESKAITPTTTDTYPFTVDALTARYVITLDLKSSIPLVTGQITMTVTDADGAKQATVTLDQRETSASLELTNVSAVGEWKAIVAGRGLSGNGQGVSYTIFISEILKAP